MRWAIWLIVGSLATTGCVTSSGEGPNSSTALSQPVRDRLALCGAGISSGVKGEIEAKVGKSLAEGGKISAGVKQEIETAFFSGSDRSNDQVRQSYDRYIHCVENPPVVS